MARSSRTRRLVLLSSFVSLSLFAFAPLWADEPTTKPAEARVGVAAVDVPATPENFLRFVDDGKGGGRLETACVTYRNEDGVNVRLVAAVHIGERSYFEDLAKGFEGDDVVLYELVKDKDAPLPGAAARRDVPADAPENPIGDLQRMLKDTLNLEFQLDVIDYTKPNFVHADMDREAFEKAQAERGESFATLMLKQLMHAMQNPEAAAGPAAAMQDPDAMLRELVRMVTRPDMERQVKLLVARQLGQMEDAAMGLDGPDGSVILTERNKAAMKVLGDTLAAGKNDPAAKAKKKIAIFYGAAHMPDLAERLGAIGFKPVAAEWKLAWDLAIRADQPSMMEELFMGALDALEEPMIEGGGMEDEGDGIF